MASLATRRLIDSAATLEPADRALLNLWINRGFDTDRLAALSRMPATALDGRRDRIVEQLSGELGLPADDVRAALEELAETARQATAAQLDDAADDDAAAAPVNGTAAPAVAGLLLGPAAAARAVPAPAPAAATEPATQPAPTGGGRRRLMGWLAAGLAAVIVLGVLVAVLASGGSSRHRVPIAAPPATVIASASASPTSPAPTPTPPTRTAGGPVTPTALGGLPGGLAHAGGSTQLVGPTRHRRLRLRVRVRGLPAPHDGHYEVWLFNSVLDSAPLGRIRDGRRAATFRLPANARRYRWIDISFQPTGVVNHSGESELRSTNPARTPKAHRHRRRQLRRAASGSRNDKTSK
jgi:hypothetical protein